jgi:Ca2+-binding EF-hand superfamily protein
MSESQLKAMFDEMDVDKNGSLTATEIDRGLKAKGCFSEAQILGIASTIFAADKDGNRAVSYEELKKAFDKDDS